MRSRVLCSCLAALVLASTAPAVSAMQRVVVRTVEDGDSELVRRIEGQSSDLSVELEGIATAELEGAIAAQLRAGEQLAAERDALAVVWLVRGPRGDWKLYVLHPGSGRVLARNLGDDTPGVQSDSAMLEVAALVVRDALLALESGAEIGVERSAVEGAMEPSTGGAEPPAQDRARVESRRVPAREGLGDVALTAGWQLVLDGLSPLGQQGPLVSVETAHGAWLARLAVGTSLGAEMDMGPATVSLTRHTVIGVVAVRSAPSAWEWAAGVQLGAAWFERSTVDAASGWVAEGDGSYGSLLVGPDLRLTWRPNRPGSAWRVGLTAGVDYVPRAPALGLAGSSGFQRTEAQWWLQPRSSIEIGLEL